MKPAGTGIILALMSLVAALASGCDRRTSEERRSRMAIQLTSSAFSEGESIPTKYTCDGEDVSPPLRWGSVPEGAQSLALIADDPDAPRGTWVHWVIYGIPASRTELPEGIPPAETALGGALQGTNDFRRIGYGGPCPPPGSPHRYFFRLYALDTDLQLQPGATKQDFLRAVEGHIVAQGELIGRYARRR